jgi:hypothetical protein
VRLPQKRRSLQIQIGRFCLHLPAFTYRRITNSLRLFAVVFIVREHEFFPGAVDKVTRRYGWNASYRNPLTQILCECRWELTCLENSVSVGVGSPLLG